MSAADKTLRAQRRRGSPPVAAGLLLVSSIAALALSGCNWNDWDWPTSTGSASKSAQAYSLSATISGATSGPTLLINNSYSVAIASGTGTVLLASFLPAGFTYSVTVATSPSGETCTVANGSGTITSANVANIVVTCSDQAYTLGGSISGLNGSGLVLANGADTLPVNAGATTFTMLMAVADTSSYDVTVQAQPAGLACSVSHGSGTMPTSAVTSVVISCTDQPFSVGGTIAGLGNNTGLVLINGADILTVNAAATSFTMPTLVAYGANYDVTAQSTPAGLTCSIVHGSGTMGVANVTNVAVTCADQAYNLGGTITGLTQSGLVLVNGSDTLDVSANASSFTMLTPLAYTSSYALTVQTQPTGETCSVSNGSGAMPANAVTNVAVSCSLNTYTVGGSISGLSASDLVLLDNGGDATGISANAAQFSMHTGLAYGATYDVLVGTQPYGINLACTPSNASGTVGADVTTVAIDCTTVTPIQQAIAAYFDYPASVALDSHGNLFVADNGDSTVTEIPYSNGSYGTPVNLGSGFNTPWSVAVDGNGNVFVADYGNDAVKEIPYSNGSYGTPVVFGSGFNDPTGVAVDVHGNVFVVDFGNNAVKEVPYSNGSYGTPVTLGSGFSSPGNVAVDANDNVFVADYGNSAVKEIPYSNGSYGTPVSLGSGFDNPWGVAVDDNDNVFVADSNNNAVKEIPYSNGSYGTPVTLGSGFYWPSGVVVDGNGDVFVADYLNGEVKQIPYSNGSYGTPVSVGPGFDHPTGIVVDSSGNVFVADTSNNAVKEIPYSNGSYGTAVSLGSGFSEPYGVAVDRNGNVFVADYGNNAIKEIPYSNGSYGTPVSLGSGFDGPDGVAVDSHGNVLVADYGNDAVKEIPYSNGSYGTPVTVGSASGPWGVTLDANDDVFVADYGDGTVEEISYSNGSYGAPLSVGSGFNEPADVAVDANGNVFVDDYQNNAVKEIPYSNGSYGAPLSLGSGFNEPDGVAVDSFGRVYAIDGYGGYLWMFLP